MRIKTLALLILCLMVEPSVAEQEAVSLYETAKNLEIYQDKVAQGNLEAKDMSVKLMHQLEEDIKQLNEKGIRTQEYQDAVLIYLLNGGNPGIIKFGGGDKSKNENSPLIEGVLAYSRADRSQALKFLKNTNEAKLRGSIGGRIALIKAILMASDDPELSLRSLALVRALVPGTLIEEASLRRCIVLSAKIKNKNQFLQCASRYIRNYSQSLFWQDFETNFCYSILHLADESNPSNLYLLTEPIRSLPENDQREIMLRTSNLSLKFGHTKMAQNIALKVMTTAFADTLHMKRANLYSVTASILAQPSFDRHENLKKLKEDDFDTDDQRLYQAIVTLEEKIMAPPNMTVDEAIKKVNPDEREDSVSADLKETIQHANEVLTQPVD